MLKKIIILIAILAISAYVLYPYLPYGADSTNDLRIFAVVGFLLTVINGVTLVYQFLSDQPKINIKPVHEELFNWFFELPILEKTIEGKKITGRYGFLTYLAIGNLSRRPVGINSWHLTLPGKTGGVDAITISEPQITLYSAKKAYPVLGIKTENHKGETYLPGGGGTAGFAYYDVEVYGEPLKESNGKITGFVKCKDIYGNTAKTAIVFKKIDIKKLRKIIPNFDGDKNKEKSREYDKLLDD